MIVFVLFTSSNQPFSLSLSTAELGDYDPEEHKGNYIADLKLIPSQNEKIEMEAIEIHQNELRNQTPAEAELHFLERASKLETYGIDPHQVKDQQKNALFIGINYSGILAFQSNRKVYHFKWYHFVLVFVYS